MNWKCAPWEAQCRLGLGQLFAQSGDAQPARENLDVAAQMFLDPAHVSFMVSLFAKSTAIPVSEVQEGMHIEPNHVYVIPHNRLLTVSAAVLYLTEPVETHAAYTSIDWFLRSLAEDQREYAICILLSGTGSHGTAGLRAIKARALPSASTKPVSTSSGAPTGRPSAKGTKITL